MITGGNGEQPDVVHQIHILTFADGRCAVSGNIDNKQVAYGLLELARDAIHDHINAAQKNQPVIQQVTPALARHFGGKG